jgi:protein CWC15
MTTAHRPTWKAAVGQGNDGGWFAGGGSSAMTSALDAPAHTKLKLRQSHQVVDRKEALKQSLLELEEAEIKVSSLPRKPINLAIEEQAKVRLLKQTAEVDVEKIKAKYDDSDVDGGESEGSNKKENGTSDNDDDETDLDNDSDSSEDDGDDDDEDDEAALLAELGRIRAEREAAKLKMEQAEAAEENERLEQAAVLGNPLLTANTSSGAFVAGRLKRRWNDDVVFRNQAKGEPIPQKRFINDTVRNDFHKRFLNKFIR